jgi:hypothetical protein
MISQINLHSLQQELEIKIRNFAAHVKGQVELCNLVVNCTCGVNVRYTDQIVHDIIVHGLHDQDHQWEVLGDQDQDMSLDAILKLLEMKEMGRKIQASILGKTGGLASPHTRGHRADPTKQQQQQDKGSKCNYCRKTGHSANKLPWESVENRKENCPAFTTKCEKCSKLGHYAKLCHARKTPDDSNKAKLGKEMLEKKVAPDTEGAVKSTDMYKQMCAAILACHIPRTASCLAPRSNTGKIQDRYFF